MAAVEVFSRQDDRIGEGPWWAPEVQALYWIDIAGKRLQRRTLAGSVTAWTLAHRPGCVVGLEGGDLVVASGEGLHRFFVSTGVTRLLQRVALVPGVRFNEGKTDPSGRLWFGSMQDNFGPNDEEIALLRSEGTLFRVDADGTAAIVEQGVGISNTLCWSPDERRFYFADSLVNRIFAYDYEPTSGAVSGKRMFFEEAGLGIADGSAMDVDGCLWNARWGAGMVLRITPDGRIDRRIEIPALQPSSCAFGGPRLETLFVTSARHGMTPSALALAPLSGSVFAITGGAQGVPVPPMRWYR